jgi:hypothetical protein
MARAENMDRTLGFEPGSKNRYMQVLELARQEKQNTKPLQRPSLAEEFFRENPMPWLLDADPVDEPGPHRRSA